MTVQVHQTEIFGNEKRTFAEEIFSAAAGLAEHDYDDSPPRHDDAAVCCWYQMSMGRVG